jgi:hypothetical protein
MGPELEGVPHMPTWKIWGDDKDPLFEGNEDEVKTAFVTTYASRKDTYVEDPDGNEYVYDSGKWKELT